MSICDRDLLELAAKAAGYQIEWVRNSGCFYRCEEEVGREQWDPLNDEGDALRLAIKLDIHIKRYAGATTAQQIGSLDSYTEHDHWAVNEGDPMASTMRAITRAAAALGGVDNG